MSSLRRKLRLRKRIQEIGTPRLKQGEALCLDFPIDDATNRKFITIEGWYVARTKYYRLRLLLPGGEVIPLKTNIPRQDVVNHFKNIKRKVPLKCGFSHLVNDFIDGIYTIQASDGDFDWHDVKYFVISYDKNFKPKPVLENEERPSVYTQHLQKLRTKKGYFFEKKVADPLKRNSNDPAVVAFYLPQFHTFKENSEWWGEGFTEWSNVGAAQPRFVGHEQPRTPSDLGYYNLIDVAVHKKQAELAKSAGIYGFCYYYYWFSGKRLLSKPLDVVLKNKDLAMPYMICWANENWTRRWDGLDKEVLIEQENSPDDPINFIKDIEEILLDERYITIDGKPVFMVYRAEDLGEPLRYTKIWRDYFRRKHGKELHIIAVRSFGFSDASEFGFDKGLSFTPLSISEHLVKEDNTNVLDREYEGYVVNYKKTVSNIIADKSISHDYQSVMPSWDNDARRKGKGSTIFYGSNPDIYGRWLKHAIEKSKQEGLKFTFVNAWNEWAEGAYLEPDNLYGHAYLNRTREIIASFSSQHNQNKFPLYGFKKTTDSKVAIVLHLYHTDLWPFFLKYIQRMKPSTYDLHVSIPVGATEIRKEIETSLDNVYVYELPNMGRDVLPFMHLSQRLLGKGYESVLKIHSKKSVHREDGNEWLIDMMEKLIPDNKKLLRDILTKLNMKRTGLIGPANHFVSLKNYIGSNEEVLRTILADVGFENKKTVTKNLNTSGFFAGTMFWARLDAISPILERSYHVEEFHTEEGQLDATFAHAMERSLSLIPQMLEKNIYEVSTVTQTLQPVGRKSVTKQYRFASEKGSLIKPKGTGVFVKK